MCENLRFSLFSFGWIWFSNQGFWCTNLLTLFAYCSFCRLTSLHSSKISETDFVIFFPSHMMNHKYSRQSLFFYEEMKNKLVHNIFRLWFSKSLVRAYCLFVLLFLSSTSPAAAKFNYFWYQGSMDKKTCEEEFSKWKEHQKMFLDIYY